SDVGVGGERRVEGGAELCHPRDGAQQADGFGTLPADGFVGLLAVGPEEGGGPLASAGLVAVGGAEASAAGAAGAAGAGTASRTTRATSGMAGEQTPELPLDRREGLLEVRHPGEPPAIVDLQRCQAGIEDGGTLQRQRGA